MRIRLNQKLLSEIPPPIRELVIEWKTRYRKVFVSRAYTDKFCLEEDANVSAFGPDSTRQDARVAGEFAGLTTLAPGQDCPLPEGCSVVTRGFFCGEPWLTIYHLAPELKQA